MLPKLSKIDTILYLANHIISHVPSHTIRLSFYRNVLGLEIGVSSYVFMGAWFDSTGNFFLGKNSVINQKCRLDNRGRITIGENVSISGEVVILTADHDPNSQHFDGRVRPVTIDDYAFLGTRCMVLPGCHLATGCVVGAGSVVTKNVEEYSIVAGVPAKRIGERNKHLCYKIDYGRIFF